MKKTSLLLIIIIQHDFFLVFHAEIWYKKLRRKKFEVAVMMTMVKNIWKTMMAKLDYSMKNWAIDNDIVNKTFLYSSSALGLIVYLASFCKKEGISFVVVTLIKFTKKRKMNWKKSKKYRLSKKCMKMKK